MIIRYRLKVPGGMCDVLFSREASPSGDDVACRVGADCDHMEFEFVGRAVLGVSQFECPMITVESDAA